MIFECKASFASHNAPVRPGRAKIGLAGKNGAHFILIGFASSREKLSLQSIDKVTLSHNQVRFFVLLFSLSLSLLLACLIVDVESFTR